MPSDERVLDTLIPLGKLGQTRHAQVVPEPVIDHCSDHQVELAVCRQLAEFEELGPVRVPVPDKGGTVWHRTVPDSLGRTLRT